MAHKSYSAVPGDNNRCECADPGCPVHAGKSVCGRTSQDGEGGTILFRGMEDITGTLFCDECTENAMCSGLFTQGGASGPGIKKFCIYTGPTLVQSVAALLRLNHFSIEMEGTERVWLCTSRSVDDILTTLNGKGGFWSTRDILEVH